MVMRALMLKRNFCQIMMIEVEHMVKSLLLYLVVKLNCWSSVSYSEIPGGKCYFMVTKCYKIYTTNVLDQVL